MKSKKMYKKGASMRLKKVLALVSMGRRKEMLRSLYRKRDRTTVAFRVDKTIKDIRKIRETTMGVASERPNHEEFEDLSKIVREGLTKIGGGIIDVAEPVYETKGEQTRRIIRERTDAEMALLFYGLAGRVTEEISTKKYNPNGSNKQPYNGGMEAKENEK